MSEQSSQRSVFFDEWIKSLREQYKYVIRKNDQVTLPSLTKVMHNVGFTDDELNHLRLDATMHVDAVDDDFVPDLGVLDNPPAGQPHPAECLCPQCVPIDESQFDADGQPLKAIDPEEVNHEAGHVFPAAKIEATDDLEDDEPIDDVEMLEPEIDDVEEDEIPTFEESLDDDVEAEDDSDDLEDDEPEDDPDAPKQMSMF